MSNAAQAYARTAQTIASPRQVEAQALLKAAKKLQDAAANWDSLDNGIEAALMFNRKLWSIFLSEAIAEGNEQPLEVRQKIANIGIFVLTQCAALQLKPEMDKLQGLIDINRHVAAGLSGNA